MCTNRFSLQAGADNFSGSCNSVFDVRTDLSGRDCLFRGASVCCQTAGTVLNSKRSGREVESLSRRGKLSVVGSRPRDRVSTLWSPTSLSAGVEKTKQVWMAALKFLSPLRLRAEPLWRRLIASHWLLYIPESIICPPVLVLLYSICFKWHIYKLSLRQGGKAGLNFFGAISSEVFSFKLHSLDLIKHIRRAH